MCMTRSWASRQWHAGLVVWSFWSILRPGWRHPPNGLGSHEFLGLAGMITVYDAVTIVCFICIVLTYFMFTEGGTKLLAHFMLPALAFAIANQLGNAGMTVLAII